MKKTFIAAVFVLLPGCLPQAEPNQIIVDGEAKIEAMPDLFDVSASVDSRGTTREEALAGLAAIYAEMMEQLPQLEGLEEIKITTSNASVAPILDYKCKKDTYDDEECPIVGYRGFIAIDVEGSPAKVAGNMLSLASELGASTANLNAFRISNRTELEKKAMSAAVENARKKAELIAGASGSTIASTIKIQSGEGFDENFFASDRDRIVVTASRDRTSHFSIDINPQPIWVRAEVVAAFAIE